MNVSDAEKYAPYLYFDLKEPFYPVLVGVTAFREPARSPSFPRDLLFKDARLERIIEYAIYLDYDIGHLYELEHVWVYVGRDGSVLDCEASFHGKYLKALLKDRSNLAEGTHVRLYSQPGKHAFSPLPELFELLPDLYSAASENAGNAGLLVPDMFKGLFATDEETDRQVRRVLQSYAFAPSMEFAAYRLSADLFVTWEQLFKSIPIRIKNELDRIRNHPVNR
jgi:hypothetical protein